MRLGAVGISFEAFAPSADSEEQATLAGVDVDMETRKDVKLELREVDLY